MTLGQIKTLIGAIEGLPIEQLKQVVAEKGENLSDDAVLAADVLGDFAAFLPPPLGAYAGVAATLLELASIAASGITVQPDPDPEVDAQTTRPFNPGDPAVRL